MLLTVVGEKVLLDLFDDFLGLGDSLGDDLLHDFHNFVHLDLQISSDLSDLGAHISSKSIFTFEVGCKVDDLGTDDLDDFLGLGDSLLDSFTDNFVDLSSFDLQFFGSFFQSSAHICGEDVFTGDGVLNEFCNQKCGFDLTFST